MSAENDKTIFMPKKLLQKWLKALRSGKYRQGHGALKQKYGEEHRYCCLGVLMDVSGEKQISGNFPPEAWCRKNRVALTHVIVFTPVKKETFNPRIGADPGHTCSGFNDMACADFTEIADRIEKYYGGPLSKAPKK